MSFGTGILFSLDFRSGIGTGTGAMKGDHGTGKEELESGTGKLENRSKNKLIFVSNSLNSLNRLKIRWVELGSIRKSCWFELGFVSGFR
jgi:hypothetical protein